MSRMSNRYSLYSFWCCSLLILATAFLYYPRWKQHTNEATITWDVSGYYLYLPAFLIHQDAKQLAFFPEIDQKYHPGPGMGQAYRHEASGNYVMKYSMGQALQFLPWFSVAHVLAPALGYPADGFSYPYQMAISWGSLLIALLGLSWARRALLYYFSDKAVAIALFLMVFGSNYLNYTAIDGAMTHNWLFTLYAALLLLTIRFYQNPSWKTALQIGICVGWATLTRPTEIVVALIPLLWAADGHRWAFLLQHRAKLLAAAAVAAAFIFLQPLYWKWATGEWLVYTYQDQGFDWLHPYFTDVLFSFKAGWLPYSPVMAFALVGLFALWRQQRRLFWPLLAVLLLITYITCAWKIWWYGGSFGARAMVQSHALWLFPLAAFAQGVLRVQWAKWVVVPLSLFFIWHNLWWTHQAHIGGLFVTEQMTQAYFLKVYGKSEKNRDWAKLLDHKDDFRVKERDNVQVLFDQRNQIDTAANPEAWENGKLRLDQTHAFTPKYTIRLLPDTEQRWLRIYFRATCTEKEWEPWKMAQLVAHLRREGGEPKGHSIRVHRLLDNGETRDLYMDIKVRDKAADYLDVYFWNPGSDKKIFFENVVVEQFREK